MHHWMRVTATSVTVLVWFCAMPSMALEHPGKPKLSASQPATIEGTDVFNCGTYRGSYVETQWLKSMHESQRRMGRQLLPAAANSIHDDVWIVEDDGTLLFTGTNVFDTDFTTFRFTPNVSAGYDITEVTSTWDPVHGTNLGLGDDTNTTVNLMFTFDFFGVPWTSVHANSNGIVGFGADINPSGFFDNGDFFNDVPKIAAYFIDLNPAAGGSVHHKAEATKSTFTWNAVPEFGTGNINTVQVVLYDNDEFDITFNGIASTLAANTLPITVGNHPGGMNPNLEFLSFSDEVPYVGSAGAGLYETYQNFTNPLVNEVALFQEFYQTFPDDFFQLVFFTDFVQTMSGFANHRIINNDVSGIGVSIFDGSAAYGSNGVLEGRCNMNRIQAWNTDPTARVFGKGNNFLTIMGQESGHRWGAFLNFSDSTGSASNLLLGRSDAHWSYYADVDHSSLEGGNWEETSPGMYICPTSVDHFCDIDHYTFGLRTPEEVSETFYVSSATNDLPQNRSVGTPLMGATCTGTPIVVTIDDIIDIEGARLPVEADEDKDLRQGWMLLHRNGQPPTMARMDQVATFRRAWEDYVEVSCDGRLTCNTSLTQTFGVGVIKGHVKDIVTKAPLDDILVESSERGFSQFVPGGGRYTFRYMADAMSGSSEGVTITAEVAGYMPDTLVTSIPYDSIVCYDFELVPIATAVDPHQDLPDVSTLEGIYPNPFNPQTTITYSVPKATIIDVAVYDAAGRLVRTLVSKRKPTGRHQVTWDGTDRRGTAVSSGVYFVRMVTRDHVQTRKVVLVK